MTLSITTPTVGDDIDRWGAELNTALLAMVDAINHAQATADAGGGGGSGALLQGNNLSDLLNKATARTNLSLGTAALSAATAFDAAGDAATAQGAAATDATTKVAAETARAQTAEALALAKSANLTDLASVATARTNLGLGGAAVLNVGTTAGTVAAGDDSRLVAATGVASGIDYDPSTSTGMAVENDLIPEGVPILAPVSAANVQAAIDDLNRKTWASDLQFLMLGIELTQQKIQPQVGAQPLTQPDGSILFGIKPQGVLANNSGTALTLSSARMWPTQDITLTGNATLTLPDAAPGAELIVACRQDSTASRTLAWAAAAGQTLKWQLGVIPTQTATPAGTLDVYRFLCMVSGTWLCYRAAIDVR